MLLGPIPIAMLTSAVVLLGFVLPSFWELLNTPPIRVIRSQEKSVSSMFWMLLAGTASLVLFSIVLTENMVLTAMVIGAIIILCSAIQCGLAEFEVYPWLEKCGFCLCPHALPDCISDYRFGFGT
jgi:predicted lysophospholipase L1 biosynthesis ABC-type transport system permease subunit